MHINTVKTTMQVTVKFSNVVDKVKTSELLVLYHGSLAAAFANFVGGYSWFFTYNFLLKKCVKHNMQLGGLGQRVVLGFCSSAISDACSNSIHVIKEYK
eukprot:10447469-Ditylum_brightwellii.AAC.1